MSGSRTILIVVALAALLVVTLAVPVAAAKTKLAIVNGIPGKSVDVCVNGREIKSGLRYGQYKLKTTRTAKARIQIYKRDRRTCRGRLIAKKWVALADATVVVTRLAPKVVVFDNSSLAQPTAADSIRTSARHAADIGAADFSHQAEFYDPSPISPAVAFSKGGDSPWNFFYLGNPGFYALVAYLAGTDTLLADFTRNVEMLRRWELILVGTNLNNTRFVFIDRAATPVS